MSCTITRIDDQNFNLAYQVGPAYPAYDPSRNKVYFVYSDRRTSRSDSSLRNTAVVFREYDVLNDALAASPVVIEAIPAGVAEDSDQIDNPSIVRLDDGRLICAYLYFSTSDSLLKTHVKESTDNGATWSASQLMDTEVGSSRQFVDMGTDGTNVFGFTYQQGGGSGGQNLWAWKRNSDGTWSTAGNVYDGHVAGPLAGEVAWQYLGGKHMVVVESSTKAMILVQREYSATQQRITCFRTTDGSSWSEVVVQDMDTDIMNSYPICFKGTDYRVRALWLITNPTHPTSKMPVLAYSDDTGATWTIIGTPALMNVDDTTAWKPQNKGFVLGPANEMVVSTWRQVLSLWDIFIYKGGDDLTSWTLTKECEIAPNVNSNLVGTSVLMNGPLIHVLDPIPNPPGTYYSIAYLREEAVAPPNNPPPLIAQSATGADAANIYLRNELRVNRGWSAHDLPVSSWMHWFEGDYTTQRRVPVPCASNPILDPRVQDPAIIPAIWKIDDESRFTIEAFEKNADGSFASVGYPVEFVWASSEMDLTGDFKQNVVRAILFKYRRPTYPFDLEIWIDSKIAQVTTIQPRWPEPGQVFIPLSAFSNTGNRVQLRVKDRTDVALIIESFEVVYIPKGHRGAN